LHTDLDPHFLPFSEESIDGKTFFILQDYSIDLSDNEGIKRESQAAVYKIPVKGPKVGEFFTNFEDMYRYR